METQETKKRTQNIQRILKKHITANSTILLGVSGGPDSQFLLRQLIIHQQLTKFKIICAHLDHKIREEGKDDAKFLNLYIKSLKSNTIQFINTSKDIKKIAEDKKISTEEAGRNERYKFFGQICKEKNINFILTGHHADDNAETILFNLIRGTSLKGLSGMQEIQSLDPKFNIPTSTKLLRPLLKTTKKEILEDLVIWKIPYLIDKTNASNDYTRNLIRNKIIPKINKINPSFSKTLARNTTTINETFDCIKTIAQEWVENNTTTSKNNNESKTTFKAQHFLQQHIIIQKEITKLIYKQLIGNTKDISQENISEVIMIIKNNIGNKEKKLCQTTFKINHNIVTCKQNTKSQ